MKTAVVGKSLFARYTIALVGASAVSESKAKERYTKEIRAITNPKISG